MHHDRCDPVATRICDQRSRRVIFVAHCLLNENTRYLGGARCGGAVREIAAGRKELRDVPQSARHVVAVRPDISFDFVDWGCGRGTVIVVERLAPLHFG